VLCGQYCDQALCRRQALLSYFGEPPSRATAGSGSRCCDYCASPARAKEQASLLKSLGQGGSRSLAFASTETFIRRVSKPEYEDFSGMCEARTAPARRRGACAHDSAWEE
jgi:superfamily II DNA helicase RecQ